MQKQNAVWYIQAHCIDENIRYFKFAGFTHEGSLWMGKSEATLFDDAKVAMQVAHEIDKLLKDSQWHDKYKSIELIKETTTITETKVLKLAHKDWI